MLQYAEPVDVRTLILLALVPSSPSYEDTPPEPPEDAFPEPVRASSLPDVPKSSSYVVGPMETRKLIPLRVRLSTGETSAFYIPPSIPLSILTQPIFQEGYEWGYTEGIPEEEEYTVPRLLNEVFGLLTEMRNLDKPDFCPWTLGFVLGELAYLAEQDRTLALTGLAHYCFILSFVPAGGWGYPFQSLLWAYWPHTRALKAYRTRVRTYREQGKSFEEAQRLALEPCEPSA